MDSKIKYNKSSPFQVNKVTAGDRASEDVDNESRVMGSGRGGPGISRLLSTWGAECKVEKVDLFASGRR